MRGLLRGRRRLRSNPIPIRNVENFWPDNPVITKVLLEAQLFKVEAELQSLIESEIVDA